MGIPHTPKTRAGLYVAAKAKTTKCNWGFGRAAWLAGYHAGKHDAERRQFMLNCEAIIPDYPPRMVMGDLYGRWKNTGLINPASGFPKPAFANDTRGFI